MNYNLDILAFGAHPDDVDACCGGTIIQSVKEGMKVGIVDLTAGDDSETANGETRIKESQKSAKIMGVTKRINLDLPERDFINIENENRLAAIIREFKPSIVLLPYWEDRHRGHRDASYLCERAVQTAKYHKIMPEIPAHKVKIVAYYMIHYEFTPSFIFDISAAQEKKRKALYCHKSQIFEFKSGKYTNTILDPDFFEAWEARSRWQGFTSGVKYGEAFALKRTAGINSLTSLTNLYR